MNQNYLYEPKNNIYINEDKKGKTKHIIGCEEDLSIMTGIARVKALKEITNSGIQNTLLGFRNRKKTLENK